MHQVVTESSRWSLSYLSCLFICHFQLTKKLLTAKFLLTQLSSINQKKKMLINTQYISWWNIIS